jgi:tRNA dimethylallyltransferase
LQKKAPTENTKFKYHIIGLKRARENIYRRINLRVEKMIKDGFIEEVKTLRHLNGVYTKEEAINLIKIETRHYAKRQMTWFKNKIENIEWIDFDEYDESEVVLKIENKIDNKCRGSIH